jgi:D-3-phosphoglycerate dehydrogenase
MLKLLIAETSEFSKDAIIALEKFAQVDLKDIQINEVAEALNQYDVFWFRLGFKLTTDLILQSTQCKYIICPVTGLDHIDLEACKQKGIKVISLKGEVEFLTNIRATAEHTLGLTLALLRHIPQAYNSVKSNNWNRELFKGSEIFGKKVGILGVGRLGSITAGYFKAIGAEVFGFDIRPFDESICKSVISIENLFSTCDIISIHVNLNSSTQNLIGYNILKLMPKGSFLINTSRGAIVKSEDLIKALEDEILAGAACDVIETEFDHKNDSLVKYAAQNEKLILTPHIGGNTFESFRKTELFMCKKLANQIINL